MVNNYVHKLNYLFNEKLHINIKEKLSSTQSAILLNDLYDQELIFSSTIGNLEENILGFTLKRKEEDISYYNRYKYYIKEYIGFNIKKYTNLTLNDYLNLTPFEANTYKEICLETAKKESEVMQDVEKDSENRIRKLNSINGLEELLGGNS